MFLTPGVTINIHVFWIVINKQWVGKFQWKKMLATTIQTVPVSLIPPFAILLSVPSGIPRWQGIVTYKCLCNYKPAGPHCCLSLMLDLRNISSVWGQTWGVNSVQLGTLITVVQIDPNLFLHEMKHLVTIPKTNKLVDCFGVTLNVENRIILLRCSILKLS